MSADLTWLLIKNNNSFLVKRNGVQLSSERGNLTNLNSFKYSGLANEKVIGVEPAENGVTVISKKIRVPSSKPAQNIRKVTLKKGVRRAAKSFTNAYTRLGYRPDLRKEALARISAIHQSRKPVKKHAAKTSRRYTKKAEKKTT